MEKAANPNSDVNLTVEGQRLFWDRQADTYEHASLTENEDELTEVAESVGVIDFKEGTADVVVFGGAVGSRDPGVVVDTLLKRGIHPEKIYFNDLSVALVERANEGQLAVYRSQGIQTETLPGRIIDVVAEIPSRPRAFFFGAYSADSLMRMEGLDGIDNYLRNPNLVGETLDLQWFSIKKGKYEECGVVESIRSDSKNVQESRKRLISQMENNRETPAAIRVVGTSRDRTGYFLSHWFNEAGLKEIVKEAFDEMRHQVRLKKCDKCWVVEIRDPNHSPTGVITMLNNVIGNVLPDEQLSTLKAIRKVASLG
jgi:hypothetical protein